MSTLLKFKFRAWEVDDWLQIQGICDGDTVSSVFFGEETEGLHKKSMADLGSLCGGLNGGHFCLWP